MCWFSKKKKIIIKITKHKFLWHLFSHLFQTLLAQPCWWAVAFYHTMAIYRSWQRKKTKKKAAGNAWANVEFCGMTWLEARVVKTNTMFHQSGSYHHICLSKQPVRQFKHHRHKRSADDSRVYSHNIWRVSHIQDCDIIFFLLFLVLPVHQLWIEKFTKTTHTSASSVSLYSERSSGQYS